MDLVKEIFLELCWDEEEFVCIKIVMINQIKWFVVDLNIVVNNVYNKLFYGENYIFSYLIIGIEEFVIVIIIDDLKVFYINYFLLIILKFYVVGKIDKEKVFVNLKGIEEGWVVKEVIILVYFIENNRDKVLFYFVDILNVK